MKMLPRMQFGNPILRKKARRLTVKEISHPATQRLIAQLFLMIRDIGVGLAAPQVGVSVQLAVVDIHPLPHRPRVQPFRRVLINPTIIASSKARQRGYEGCLSFDGLRAEADRAKRIQVRFYDENGERHVEWVEGFPAKVLQHEIDHLRGVLFVDHVNDSRTIMTTAEFEKRIRRM